MRIGTPGQVSQAAVDRRWRHYAGDAGCFPLIAPGLPAAALGAASRLPVFITYRRKILNRHWVLRQELLVQQQ